MSKKLFIGMFFLTGIIFLSAGSIFAAENTNPWQSMPRFRDKNGLMAQSSEMSKEDFIVYRNKAREQHREERMAEREARLKAAVQRGCITEEEMAVRMQEKRGRFLK